MLTASDLLYIFLFYKSFLFAFIINIKIDLRHNMWYNVIEKQERSGSFDDSF